MHMLRTCSRTFFLLDCVEWWIFQLLKLWLLNDECVLEATFFGVICGVVLLCGYV